MSNENATVSSLLKIPSLAHSFLAAGKNGVHRKIDRIDVLEHPWPEVEEYLLPGIFFLTSFWSSKHNKNARINLIKAMIEHGCSGIGIMPSLHLNKMVDPEIIEFGNQYDFPVIILDEDCRYNEITKEFYLHAFSLQQEAPQRQLFHILTMLDQYKTDRNLLRLGIDMECMLSCPVLINSGDAHYISAHIVNAKILSKIQSLYFGKNYIPYAPVYPYVNEATHIVCVFGISSYIALFLNPASAAKDVSAVFLEIAAYLLRLLDSEKQEQVTCEIDESEMSETDRFYLFYIKLPNLTRFLNSRNRDYFVYNYNRSASYAIGLWQDSGTHADSVFGFCRKVIEEHRPICLVFSDYSVRHDSITKLSKYVIEQMEPLLIYGVFTMGELPVLNLLNIAPTTMKLKMINSYLDFYVDANAKQIYLDTTRLFLALCSITKTSELLGVHINTTKYRILKVLRNVYDDDFSLLASKGNMECLLALENLKLEQRREP